MPCRDPVRIDARWDTPFDDPGRRGLWRPSGRECGGWIVRLLARGSVASGDGWYEDRVNGRGDEVDELIGVRRGKHGDADDLSAHDHSDEH